MRKLLSREAMRAFTDKHHKAPWSPLLILMSIGLTILCGGLAFRFFVRGSGMEVMIGVGMLAITFGCALFTIRGYTITRNALLVHRLLWNTRLSLDGLKSARFELGAMRWGIRCGNGGFFSFTGLFYNRKLGFHRAFVTDHIRTVVLRYPHRIVVVSPADPEAFVRDLAIPIKAMTWDEQARINEVEWQKPGNWTGPKWLSVYFSKRDSRAWWCRNKLSALGSTVNLGNPHGAFALLAIVSAIIIALVVLAVVLLAVFKPVHPNSIRSDYIGQAWFLKGDSIEITSVDRTEKRMVVKGHYNLVSHDQATLALYITTKTNTTVPETAGQRMVIPRGRGDFGLIHSRLVPGLPHVSMYGTDGGSFAELYFGNQAEALEESKLNLDYSKTRDGEPAAKSSSQVAADGGLAVRKMPGGSSPVEITASKITYDSQNQTLTASGNVEIKYKYPQTNASAELEFRLVAAGSDTNTPADELADPNDRTGQTKLRILKEVLLDSSAVASASLESGQSEDKIISVVLKSNATQKFSDITAANIGRRLAIVWRGRILSAPVIRD